MRSLRPAPYTIAWPSLRHGEGLLPGLPFVSTACAPGLAFGWSACIAALVVAAVASFLVYVPLTALALNGGRPIGEDAPAPTLTPRAYGVLLGLWSATAWTAALVVGQVQ